MLTSAQKYWEVTIPTPNKLPMREGEELIRIGELDPMAKGSFPVRMDRANAYTSSNWCTGLRNAQPSAIARLPDRVQYEREHARLRSYRCRACFFPLFRPDTSELGAQGKTDVAMLTVLRALSQHAEDPRKRPLVSASDFKVIYVAPMKALAAEIVRKMSKRLSWLGIVVKELTGDMQLTRAEIAATHFIVTTPEKWDVVTRKPEGDAELASVRFLSCSSVVHDRAAHRKFDYSSSTKFISCMTIGAPSLRASLLVRCVKSSPARRSFASSVSLLHCPTTSMLPTF